MDCNPGVPIKAKSFHRTTDVPNNSFPLPLLAGGRGGVGGMSKTPKHILISNETVTTERTFVGEILFLGGLPSEARDEAEGAKPRERSDREWCTGRSEA